MRELMLDVDQAGELKAAFRRGDWTNGQIKKLCEGDILFRVKQVLEGSAEIVMRKVEEKIILPILNPIKTITGGKVVGKKTADCFTNKSRYYYRDSDLDSWLPKNQKDESAGNFEVQELGQEKTFLQVLQGLGITGHISVVVQEIKKRGFITTLPTIESLIERQENGEGVGLQTNGYANFFFVEDKNGGVSVVGVDRGGGRWDVDVSRLGRGSVWGVGYRFFFRN